MITSVYGDMTSAYWEIRHYVDDRLRQSTSRNDPGSQALDQIQGLMLNLECQKLRSVTTLINLK